MSKMELEQFDRAMDQRVYNYTLCQNGNVCTGRCIDLRDEDGIIDFMDIDTGSLYFADSSEVTVTELEGSEAMHARQTYVMYSVWELMPDIMYEVGKEA